MTMPWYRNDGRGKRRAAEGAPDNVLEVSGLTAGYGRVTVLHDVDLAVKSGSVTVLLGANGAGKTTLLRVVAGLVQQSSGSVQVHGEEVTGTGPARRARRGLCLIPEGRGIFRDLTVRENLRMQRPPWESEQGIDVALSAFPALKRRLKETAGNLSGGQQQMLALARCYLSGADVVLLDEVSMGLAPIIVDEMFKSMADLASRGVSLLIVEQYVSRALEIADTAYVLNRGRVTFAGASSDLDQESLADVYLSGQ